MTAITDLEDLHVRREGAAGRITLNRPKALNSLTLDMVHSFATALDGWAEDDSVRVVVIDGCRNARAVRRRRCPGVERQRSRAATAWPRLSGATNTG